MQQHTQWITCFEPLAQAEQRLLCFPQAGGSASDFRALSSVLTRGLRGRVEVWSVEYPGHGARQGEPLFTECTPLAEALAEALAPFLQEKPCSMLGVSLGAIVGTETSHLLQQHLAVAPRYLYVVACGAPHLQGFCPAIRDDVDLRAYVLGVAGLVNEQLLARQRPVFQADFALRSSYVFTWGATRLSCPISAFGGCNDDEVPEQALIAWQEHTVCQPFKHFMLPGRHAFWQREQAHFLPLLAREVAQTLNTSAHDPV